MKRSKTTAVNEMGDILKIAFMGTPEFSVPCLQKLLDEQYDICAVFTQPDKPKGRGYTLTPPPVKELALAYNIPVYQPTTLKNGEAFEILSELQPDCIVVVAYGKILPASILHLPRFGCINVHASLLPKYRGAAPIQWSVINGEKQTGVTTMFMDEGLDTGDMLLKSETPIGPDETAGDLHDRLSILGSELLIKTLKGIEEGSIKPQKQDDSLSCYASMLNKGLSVIDWNKHAGDVHNLVRGLSPWPTACGKLNGKVLKIHKTRVVKGASGRPGEILSNGTFTVCCGTDAVELLEVQPEGGKRMAGTDYLRGHPVPAETVME